MGQHVSRTDFEWVYTDMPHASRRKQILAKYPQIKKLFGHDPKFAYHVCALVLVQILMLFWVKDQSWKIIILAAYFFGGFINHSLLIGLHEVGHNLAFGHTRPTANKILGIVMNLPVGIPIAVSFKVYHRDHHRYLGQDILDPDVPTDFEAKLFCTTIGKIVWLCLQPFTYALRPLIRHPLKPTTWEYINTAVQITFNTIVVMCFGWKAYIYLLLCSYLSGSIHPAAAHYIAEHYMFAKGYETFSYYGPLNKIFWNVGYHNEHHDFPAVPGYLLPEVRRIAPEFYDNIPHHTSWLMVMYNFITDPDCGVYMRTKRPPERVVTAGLKSLHNERPPVYDEELFEGKLKKQRSIEGKLKRQKSMEGKYMKRKSLVDDKVPEETVPLKTE